jgi:hypothetical protein
MDLGAGAAMHGGKSPPNVAVADPRSPVSKAENEAPACVQAEECAELPNRYNLGMRVALNAATVGKHDRIPHTVD